MCVSFSGIAVFEVQKKRTKGERERGFVGVSRKLENRKLLFLFLVDVDEFKLPILHISSCPLIQSLSRTLIFFHLSTKMCFGGSRAGFV